LSERRRPAGPLANAKVYMVEIRARDWAALSAFYRDTLGLPEKMRDADAGFAMYGAKEPFLAVVRKPADAGPGPSRVVTDLVVDDLDGALSRLQAAGVQVLASAKDAPEGYRIARIADPEMNEIHLFEWAMPPFP
jgi:predicted enzyme related to lactoylglutathione lyase